MNLQLNRKFLAIANLCAFCFMVLVNYLANTLPLNGLKTGQISDKYSNLYVPASFTFSIWTLIYILLVSFVVYQLIAAYKREKEEGIFIDQIGILFTLSCLANIGWIFLWHYEYLSLSLLMVSSLLICLITIYHQLEIGLQEASSQKVKVFVHTTISIYMGWVTVAIGGNVAALLVSYQWGFLEIYAQYWAAGLVLLSTFIAATIFISRRDYAYTIVIIWGLLGILIKRMYMDLLPDQAVIWSVCIGISALGILLIREAIKSSSANDIIVEK